jgi:hypothetical protein
MATHKIVSEENLLKLCLKFEASVTCRVLEADSVAETNIQLLMLRKRLTAMKICLTKMRVTNKTDLKCLVCIRFQHRLS